MPKETPDRISDLLPEGFISLGIVVGIKCLNEEGDISLATYRSPDMSAWEGLGILTTLIEDSKRDMYTHEVTDD